MISNWRRMFSLWQKRLSPPERRDYDAADNEFTSEGAPVKPPTTPDRTPNPPASFYK
jgi:hypothetical protein